MFNTIKYQDDVNGSHQIITYSKSTIETLKKVVKHFQGVFIDCLEEVIIYWIFILMFSLLALKKN